MTPNRSLAVSAPFAPNVMDGDMSYYRTYTPSGFKPAPVVSPLMIAIAVFISGLAIGLVLGAA